MRPKPSIAKKPAEQVVKDIRRATRRHFSAEDKIRIVLDGLFPVSTYGPDLRL
jgi:transposase